MKKIAIVGATGYTGMELVRLLSNHPQVSIQQITSRKQAGVALKEYFPALSDSKLVFSADWKQLKQCDMVFYATPHGVAMQQVAELLLDGVKVIDLSADFRLKQADVFHHWYGLKHSQLDWLAKAAYGLSELNRKAIAQACLVANPGCYPTSIQLPLAPLLLANLIDAKGIVADCKSGVSGAGREAQVGQLFAECTESFKAYGLEGHRHTPEINQALSEYSGQSVDITFLPHLLPMARGIESSLYCHLQAGIRLEDIYDCWYQTYQDEAFIQVSARPLATKEVRGTNYCAFSAAVLPSGRLVISSVIDNLVKGASGQAVQNMNIMLGLPETLALRSPALWC